MAAAAAAASARKQRVNFVAPRVSGNTARSRVQNAMVEFLAARGATRGQWETEYYQDEYCRQYDLYGDLDVVLGKVLAKYLPAYATVLGASFNTDVPELCGRAVAYLEGAIKHAFKNIVSKPEELTTGQMTHREWLRKLMQLHMDAVFASQMQCLSDIQEITTLRQKLETLEGGLGQKRADALQMIELAMST